MGALADLLDVQALDITSDQLTHRRAHLPERAELAATEQALVALDKARETLQTERDQLAREQKRYEDEAASIEAKAAHENTTLYSGKVTAAKELQAIQDEIASLHRRQTDLEDHVLELMEQIEPLDAELAAHAVEQERLDGLAISLTAAIAEAESEIDAELETVADSRAKAAVDIPADLMEEYERLRRAFGGIGVARLVGNRCDGCHLTLPSMEVDRIRHAPPDTPEHCSECDRILVR
jgi:predicted  nucleic acid-binding Zn-ribbon protein